VNAIAEPPRPRLSSFLIGSPLVNEVAVVLLYGPFGFEIAAIHAVAGRIPSAAEITGHLRGAGA